MIVQGWQEMALGLSAAIYSFTNDEGGARSKFWRYMKNSLFLIHILSSFFNILSFLRLSGFNFLGGIRSSSTVRLNVLTFLPLEGSLIDSSIKFQQCNLAY